MRMGKSTVHEGLPCPACGVVLNAATEVGAELVGGGPDNGSITLCAVCGELLMFKGTPPSELVLCPAETLAAMDFESRCTIKTLRDYWLKTKEKRNEGH